MRKLGIAKLCEGFVKELVINNANDFWPSLSGYEETILIRIKGPNIINLRVYVDNEGNMKVRVINCLLSCQTDQLLN